MERRTAACVGAPSKSLGAAAKSSSGSDTFVRPTGERMGGKFSDIQDIVVRAESILVCPGLVHQSNGDFPLELQLITDIGYIIGNDDSKEDAGITVMVVPQVEVDVLNLWKPSLHPLDGGPDLRFMLGVD